MRRLATGVLGLALAAGFYLLLIDTVSLPELYAGCGVVLLAWIAFELSREQGVTEASISPRWLLGVWRAAVKVPGNIALLCLEAVAQLQQRSSSRGQFRAIPFEGGDGAEDHGRRALTEIVGSLAPNTIVLGVDPDRDLLLVHQLRRSGGRREIDLLRLG